MSWNSFLKQKLRHLSVGRYYRLKDKILLGLFNGSHFLLYLSGIIFALVINEPMIVIMGLITRWSLLFVGIDRLLKKTKEKFEIAYIGILDIVYLGYYIYIGINALLRKRIEWT